MSTPVPSSRRTFLVGALAGGASVAVGSLVPVGTAFGVDGEEPSEVDVGFCTDMAAHHLQALVLCQRVLGRDTGDAVQAAAAEVLQNQAMEVGKMQAWLADWGRPTAVPETTMAWMHGVGVPLADMPGYATDAELTELSTSTGTAQGRQWLQLMRAHHVGGVHMAEHAATHAGLPKVVTIAETMAEAQTFEIAQYDVLLAGTYA
ncbi:hypothetical protein B7486_60320 [cyanobacterium TDX16]|nr:hypothetical protein B7486_60320 [cyanobacterium TDX16]